MTAIRMALVLSCAALLSPWVAQGQDKPLTAQQERMKSCNAEARDKHMKGEERRDFMSHCLKGESGERERTAQQEKMVSCNRDASAKGLKGDQRRGFMRECLSADSRSPSAAGR